jgi:hypothetical protein
MRRLRRNHSPAFKAKVALAALAGVGSASDRYGRAGTLRSARCSTPAKQPAGRHCVVACVRTLARAHLRHKAAWLQVGYASHNSDRGYLT